MAKQTNQRTDLDKRVEKFLANGVSMNNVFNYTLKRSFGTVAVLTVEFYAGDLEAIKLEPEESNG